MIHGIHHTSIAVSDLDKMLGFYRDLIGFRLIHEGSWEVGNARLDALVGLEGSSARYVMLHGGNLYLEMFQYSSPVGRPGDPDRPVCDAGLTHICLVTDDIDADYERLCAAGTRFHAPPGPPGVMRATYGRDPEGNVFELIQFDGDHNFAFARLEASFA